MEKQRLLHMLCLPQQHSESKSQVLPILICNPLPHNLQDWGGGKITDTHRTRNALLKYVIFRVVLSFPSTYSNFVIL